MGQLRNVYITEPRTYDNPNDPVNSPYDVSVQTTVPEAVIDPETGESLLEMLQKMKSGLFAFEIGADGDLYYIPEDTATASPFAIDSDGFLYYTLEVSS